MAKNILPEHLHKQKTELNDKCNAFVKYYFEEIAAINSLYGFDFTAGVWQQDIMLFIDKYTLLPANYKMLQLVLDLAAQQKLNIIRTEVQKVYNGE